MKGETMDSGLSASDVLALTRNNEDGFMGGGNSWAWLIIILLFAGGGFGFGNNNRGNCATTEDLAAGFNNSTVLSNQREITNNLFGIQSAMNQGFSGLASTIDACCCKTQSNIDALRYEMSKGFCDIITNANNNTAQIINYFKDDKIHDLELRNQALTFQLSQNAQSTTIIDALKTTPAA
jgi:hypothetical protein